MNDHRNKEGGGVSLKIALTWTKKAPMHMEKNTPTRIRNYQKSSHIEKKALKKQQKSPKETNKLLGF